jgi:CheY-like chemotaxis protein
LAVIDLVVTDLVMPGIEGNALADQLRESYPNLKVLFISGYAPEGTVSDKGMDSPLLTKPFTAAQLIDRIRALLG